MALAKEQVLQQLGNMVERVKLLAREVTDLNLRILEPQVHGQPYIIEVSSGRYVRRVPVEHRRALNLRLNQPDPVVMRELRTAILAVCRLAQRNR